MPGINRKVFKALQKREKKRCLIKERIFDWHENSNPQHQMLDILSKEIFRTLHPGISWFKRIWKNAKIQKVYFVLSHFSHVWVFANPWTAACQPPLSMGFSRQENWSGLPCPPPGDLSIPGIRPRYPTLQTDSVPSEHPQTLVFITVKVQPWFISNLLYFGHCSGGFPGRASGKYKICPPVQEKILHWVEKIAWRRAWQPILAWKIP